MLDFTPVRTQQLTLPQLAATLSVADLRTHTNAVIDHLLAVLNECVDADVVFVPNDPAAKDDAAASEAEVTLPWTLGHVIVHITASSEEAAFIAAELARGVAYRQGRSRYETPWQTVTTVAQCRARLEESRRMRLASLELWPNPPHLENGYTSPYSGLFINAQTRFINGLRHDDDHLAQVAEIIRQAKAARGA